MEDVAGARDRRNARRENMRNLGVRVLRPRRRWIKESVLTNCCRSASQCEEACWKENAWEARREVVQEHWFGI